jgi:hypothetical protein
MNARARERRNGHSAFVLPNGDANPWTRGPQPREPRTAEAIAYGNAYAPSASQ